MNKEIEHTNVNEQEESEPLSLETCLLSAIMHGDIKGIKYFLELGADIECIDEEGRTPLYWASYYGQTQAALLLMEYGANVNSMTHTCATPLFIAALMGHTETVLALCDKGATVEVRETDGSMTPLFAAALNGHTEVVLALCERGADIESSDCIGVSPLFMAAAQGHKETVLALATRGADIHAVDDNGWNIPCVVAQNGHAEILAILLEHGCDIESRNSLGMTPLFVASMEGHAEIVHNLLELGADINAKTNSGDTPLIAAIRHGHTEVALMLIRQGADVNETNGSGWSAYMYNKNPEIEQELIDKGANTEMAESGLIKIGENPEQMRAFLGLIAEKRVPYVMQGDITPLMHAAHRGYTDIVIKMIHNECNINAVDSEGNTALCYAVTNKHEEIVRLLLENGANPDIKNKNGWTPLIHAASDGYSEIVSMLIKHGADLNAKEHNTNATALHLAAQNGHAETVEVLIANGANTEARQKNGATPLLMAVHQGQMTSVLTLLRNGANPEAVDPKGRTPLHIAVKCGYPEIALALINHGVIVDCKEYQGATPLFLAAAYGMLDMVLTLLDVGADINATDDTLFTPLSIAILNGHSEIAMLLMDKGADLEAKNNEGWKPLHFAAQFGNVEIAEALINKGAKLNDKEGRGATPLMVAACYGFSEIVSLLLKSGADIKVSDNEGQTPLHFAAQFGHAEVIKILIANGADINEKSNKGVTPLILAVLSEQEESVKTLLNKRIDVNAAYPLRSLYDEDNKELRLTVLALAAAFGLEKMVALLLNVPDIDPTRGAVCMRKWSDQMLSGIVYNPSLEESVEVHAASPLSLACMQGHSEIVRLLLAHKGVKSLLKTKVPVFGLWGYSTPEWERIVCAAGNKLILQMLLDFVADDKVMRERAYKALLEEEDRCTYTLERITSFLDCPTGSVYKRRERRRFQIELMLERLDESRPLLQDSMMNLLCAAAERGDSATLVLLIEKMEINGEHAQVALETAFKYANEKCIKLLLAVPGVDVMPSLIISAAKAKETCLLLLCLAHPSARKPLPVAAIMAAVEKDRAKNLQLLLNHPEKVEGSCLDALILAAKRKGKMVDVLLRAFDWSMSEVVAAFEASIMNGRMNNAHLLLEWWRKQKETKEKLSHLNDKERTAFENALIKAAGCQDGEMLDLLLSDEYEWSSAAIVSALLASVKADTQRNMEKLLTWCGQKNIDVPQSVRDDMWISSLKKKKYNLLHLMLTNLGTNVNSVVDFPHGRDCALNYAVGEGNIKLVKTLLAVKGIDVNNRDNHLEISPLCLAVTNGYKDIASLLLSTPGIDLNSTDSTGKTALDLAYYYNDTELIDMLKKLPLKSAH